MIMAAHLRPTVGRKVASSAGPVLILWRKQCTPGRGITKVTIYSGTYCKLRDGVREGNFVRTPRAYIAGTAVDRGEGECNEWRSRCEQGRTGARLERVRSWRCACLVWLG